MSACRICLELSAEVREPWNEPLLETDHFCAVPSLGALVEGWLLIFPKRHYIAMGAVPFQLRSEVEFLQTRVHRLLQRCYSRPVQFFEHGPSAEGHGTGCGVDHAHLHAVPLKCDLGALVTGFASSPLRWSQGSWDEMVEAQRAGMDYLYLKSDGEAGRLATGADFGSQSFRRAISRFLGIPDEFNWKTHPQYANVRSTISAIKSSLAQPEEKETVYAV